MKNIALYIIICFGLYGCNPKTPQFEILPPLKHALNCMPEAGAIIAAHRGTSRNWSVPENSISGLKKLIDRNYLIAEIDVARLGDGTLITFHDGVWDDISTAKGPIAASNLADLEKILLKTRRGKLTSNRPPLFEDMLKTAKNKIYLEIDFKSSVNIKTVIDMIRQNLMEDHVILIAYSAGQAKRIQKLAPDMILSAPINTSRQTSGNLVWLGKDVWKDNLVTGAKNSGQYIIGSAGQAGKTQGLKVIRRNSDILVTDYPDQYLPLTGLNKDGHDDFETCIKDGY